MANRKYLDLLASEKDESTRLDKFLIQHLPSYSRQFIQKMIESGNVLMNGKTAKSGHKLRTGAKIAVTIPPDKELNLEAKNIPLDIIYEDKNIVVVNKPAGLVVHPGTYDSHIDDSLVNAILYHCKGKLSGINGVLRPGIVHRLDKDTSGLLVVAKNDDAHRDLSEQFKKHTVKKIYTALLAGHLHPLKGSIEAPIGRDIRDRKRMAVVAKRNGKEAITNYEVLKYIGDTTLVKVQILTGRTHQIRVHFSSIGFPVVGDGAYGKREVNRLFEEKFGLKRQFLHASELEIKLPKSDLIKNFSAPLPADLKKVLR